MRFAPRLVALLLGAAALAGCSTMGATMGAMTNGLAGASDKGPVPADKAAAATKPAPISNDVEGNVRQAQLLRLAGNYDEAIHILSQLMLVASDDPHVVAEYGKSLAMKGRASEATQFLRRAVELSPNDWTLYSALGVSYDQVSDPVNARAAYEHALMLKPNEAGVLSNYALSRMLANDPQNAKMLIARAEAASVGMPDEKIVRNQALIAQMAPDSDAPKPEAIASAQKSAPATAKTAAAQTKPAPKPSPAKPAPQVASAPAPAPANTGPQNSSDVARLLASQPVVVAEQADAAPRSLAPQPPPIPVVDLQNSVAEAQPIAQAPLPVVPSGVVMQAVPYDPYAGPVAKLHPPKAVAKTVATAQASSKKADFPKSDNAKANATKAVAKAEASSEKPDAQKADTQKADAQKADTKAPAKVAAKTVSVPSLRVAADKY